MTQIEELEATYLRILAEIHLKSGPNLTSSLETLWKTGKQITRLNPHYDWSALRTRAGVPTETRPLPEGQAITPSLAPRGPQLKPMHTKGGRNGRKH